MVIPRPPCRSGTALPWYDLTVVILRVAADSTRSYDALRKATLAAWIAVHVSYL